jgi:hypothetical protein
MGGKCLPQAPQLGEVVMASALSLHLGLEKLSKRTMKCQLHWPPAKEFIPVKKRNKSFLGSDEQHTRCYFMCRGNH